MIASLIACLASLAGTACLDIPDPPTVTPVVVAVPVAQPASVQSHEFGIDLAAVQRYLWNLDARTLIELFWHGTGQTERAMKVANRESHFSCTAKNPRSSATGVFQTLRLHAPRAQRLGLSWNDIAGPNCYADIALAFDLWRTNGWAPWRLTA